MKVYHNGVQIHDTPSLHSVSNSTTTTDHALVFGRKIVGLDDHYLGCRVDDVIIFEKALNHDDVMKLSSMYP